MSLGLCFFLFIRLDFEKDSLCFPSHFGAVTKIIAEVNEMENRKKNREKIKEIKTPFLKNQQNWQKLTLD